MAYKENSGRYGINVKKYCAEHERYILSRLETDDALGALLIFHALKISWLQHERLVHLIVLFMISVLFFFSVGLSVALGNPFVLVLVAIVLVLLGAYIRHYFFLENTVQHWYTLYDRIYGKTKPKDI